MVELVVEARDGFIELVVDLKNFLFFLGDLLLCHIFVLIAVTTGIQKIRVTNWVDLHSGVAVGTLEAEAGGSRGEGACSGGVLFKL